MNSVPGSCSDTACGTGWQVPQRPRPTLQTPLPQTRSCFIPQPDRRPFRDRGVAEGCLFDSNPWTHSTSGRLVSQKAHQTEWQVPKCPKATPETSLDQTCSCFIPLPDKHASRDRDVAACCRSNSSVIPNPAPTLPLESALRPGV